MEAGSGALIRAITTTVSAASALEIIDDLRSRIESGEVVAFAAVGIEPDDATRSWTAATRPVTRLRMMGAIWSLQHGFTHE